MINFLKTSLIALTLACTGCAVPVETGQAVEVFEAPKESPDMSSYEQGGGEPDGACPATIAYLPDGNGGIIEVRLPGLCNQFYLYQGYPDPTINPPNSDNLDETINPIHPTNEIYE